MKKVNYEVELRRIENGPTSDEVPGGIGTVRFIVSSEVDSSLVLTRAKQVLSSLLREISTKWPTPDELASVLPSWFVKQCELEGLDRTTLAENEREKIVALNPWSLEGWMGWFNPDDPDSRQWRWWDTVLLDAHHMVVALEVDSWPFAYGAFSWLFRACGAIEISPESDES